MEDKINLAKFCMIQFFRVQRKKTSSISYFIFLYTFFAGGGVNVV